VHLGGRSVSIDFTGSGAQSPLSFQCSLRRRHHGAQGSRKRRRWSSCTSPATYANLRPGRYRFRVRAVDASGQRDLTPANRKLRIRS
jgi:hypothetical protein